MSSKIISSENSAFSPVLPRERTASSSQEGQGLGHHIKVSAASQRAFSINSNQESDNTSSPSANSTKSSEQRFAQGTDSSASLTSLATTAFADKVQYVEPVPHRALRILLEQEKGVVFSCTDRARKTIALCNRRIQEHEEKLSAINPTLCERLRGVTTVAEYQQIIAAVPQTSSTEVDHIFNTLRNYCFLRSLNERILFEDKALVGSNTSSLNSAVYTIQHSQNIQEHITNLDTFSNDIYEALQKVDENLTAARMESNPGKKNDYIKASNASLLRSRFLRYAVNAFLEQNQDVLNCYDERADYALMAAQSYQEAAKCEVPEVPANLGIAQTATTAVISRVINTARIAARRAGYCYQCASEAVANYSYEEQRSYSVPSDLTPAYKEAGDYYNRAFRQLVDDTTVLAQRNDRHAELLEGYANAMLGVAESGRIRVTICDTGMRATQPGDTVYFFDQIGENCKHACRLYEQALSLRDQLTLKEQSGNQEEVAMLDQQINALLEQASQITEEAAERMHQLLLDPNRISDQALRKLGYL